MNIAEKLETIIGILNNLSGLFSVYLSNKTVLQDVIRNRALWSLLGGRKRREIGQMYGYEIMLEKDHPLNSEIESQLYTLCCNQKGELTWRRIATIFNSTLRKPNNGIVFGCPSELSFKLFDPKVRTKQAWNNTHRKSDASVREHYISMLESVENSLLLLY